MANGGEHGGEGGFGGPRSLRKYSFSKRCVACAMFSHFAWLPCLLYHKSELRVLSELPLTQCVLKLNKTYINLTSFSFGRRLDAESPTRRSLREVW